MPGFSNKFVVRGALAASTADNTDVAGFIVPANREVSIYALRYFSLGRPNLGFPVNLELVSSANDNLLDVSVSVAAGVISESSDTFPRRLVNSTGADAYFKLRVDGTGGTTSAGFGHFELHLDYPDVS